jgi:polygalacturonase
MSPTTASLTTGGSRSFAATVTGSANTAVTWSVQEGSAGGSVTSAGVYTAPATAGTYHVVARSQADTTKSASATVTVSTVATGDFVDPKTYGAVGDGVADDTAAFQAAANTRKPLRITAPRVRYRITNGIRVYNSVQGDGSMPQIRLDNPSGDWGDSILQVVNYTGAGLTISGLHLNGGWTGVESSEHSSGVHIGGSHNVTVEGMRLEAFRGDGVYVGGGGFTREQSRNIVIRNNQISTVRRCAIAVIHVNGLQITGNSLSKANTYVTTIDIEPNPNGIDNVWNARIEGNTFTSLDAIAVMLYHAAGAAYPPGGVGGNITISNNGGDVARGVYITGSNDWPGVTQTSNAWR